MYVGYTESFFVRFFVILNSYVCRWYKIFRMWIFYILFTCVILNLHRWGRCLTRTGPKYIGSSFWTESSRMNVGYTNSFSICFFVNTYDTVHIILIKIHIVFTITYNMYGACGEFFFSEIGLSRGRSVTPFFGAKCPLSPLRAPLGARAYPWILSKYFLCVCACVRVSVPLQISAGCVYFV